jgi:1-acyl-sn-glycerol-3-phosphate acyltransferase
VADGIRTRPLCIFAEGTTSNGIGIHPFKRGAFLSERPIIPAYARVSRCGVDMDSASDCLQELALYFLIFASFTFHRTTVHFLPPFEPNDYFWETHADKGKDRWEIYAWAIRDVIAKKGKFTKEERNCRDIF